MTTYTSTNARPCADCGLKRCPYGCESLGLLTSILPSSTRTIRSDLSYTLTEIPSPPERYVYMEDGSGVTVPVIDLAAHPADYVTMAGVIEALEKGPESHAAGPAGHGWYMFTSMLLVFVGAVLMAFGWIFNDATSRFVWSLLQDM